MEAQVSLKWSGLFYEVKSRAAPILKSVSGEARPGELLAIIGPSGSGKSTLLDAICGEKLDGRLEGELLANGAPITKAIRRTIKYATQADAIHPLLTVRENLEYAARFHIEKSKRVEAVESAIRVFGLSECQHTQVGLSSGMAYNKPVRGVSGGERRRAYIAMLCLTNPTVMVLDEPTSGLDSTNASAMVSCLRSLANQGCTVIATLHQPSAEMFAKFDKILLMGRGYTAFYGSRDESMRFFASVGMPIPPLTTPTDHFIAKLSDNDSMVELVARFADQHTSSDVDVEAGEGKTDLVLEPIPSAKPVVSDPTTLPQLTLRQAKHKLPCGEQFEVLMGRTWKVSWLAFNPAALSLTIFLVLIIGLCGLRGKHLELVDSTIGKKNAVMFLGFIYAVGFLITIPKLSNFISELKLLLVEYKAKSYNIFIYFITSLVGSFPAELIQPTTYIVPMYFFVGLSLDSWWRIFAHIGVMILCAMIASVHGICFGALIPNEQLATLLQAVTSIAWLLTTGFYIPTDQLSWSVRWLKVVNHYYYGYSALQWIEYSGRTVRHIPGSSFLSEANLAKIGNATHYSSEIVLDQLGVTTPLWVDVLVLASMLFAYGALAYVLVRYVRVRR